LPTARYSSFVGGRDGFVYALGARTGADLWRSPLPSLVMCTPAWSEGTLYVGAGDMRVYALEGATGRRLWQSAQLPGSAMPEHWIVAARGAVIAAVEHALPLRTHWREIQQAVMVPFI
jgi:outer membrane protein assembly factor BamB